MSAVSNWFQRVKKSYSIRSSEQKMVGITALIIMASCFMPWYHGPTNEILMSRFGSNYANYNGFQSYAFILGYLVFFCSAASFYYFMADLSGWKTPKLPIENKRMHAYLGERILMFEIIALFIYTRQSFDFTSAEVRFGIYLGIIASILHMVFAYMYYKNEEHLPEISASWNEDNHVDAMTEEQYQEQLQNMLSDDEIENKDDYYIEPSETPAVQNESQAQDVLAKAKEEVLDGVEK